MADSTEETKSNLSLDRNNNMAEKITNKNIVTPNKKKKRKSEIETLYEHLNFIYYEKKDFPRLQTLSVDTKTNQIKDDLSVKNDLNTQTTVVNKQLDYCCSKELNTVDVNNFSPIKNQPSSFPSHNDFYPQLNDEVPNVNTSLDESFTFGVNLTTDTDTSMSNALLSNAHLEDQQMPTLIISPKKLDNPLGQLEDQEMNSLTVSPEKLDNVGLFEDKQAGTYLKDSPQSLNIRNVKRNLLWNTNNKTIKNDFNMNLNKKESKLNSTLSVVNNINDPTAEGDDSSMHSLDSHETIPYLDGEEGDDEITSLENENWKPYFDQKKIKLLDARKVNNESLTLGRGTYLQTLNMG